MGFNCLFEVWVYHQWLHIGDHWQLLHGSINPQNKCLLINEDIKVLVTWNQSFGNMSRSNHPVSQNMHCCMEPLVCRARASFKHIQKCLENHKIVYLVFGQKSKQISEFLWLRMRKFPKLIRVSLLEIILYEFLNWVLQVWKSCDAKMLKVIKKMFWMLCGA